MWCRYHQLVSNFIQYKWTKNMFRLTKRRYLVRPNAQFTTVAGFQWDMLIEDTVQQQLD